MNDWILHIPNLRYKKNIRDPIFWVKANKFVYVPGHRVNHLPTRFRASQITLSH